MVTGLFWEVDIGARKIYQSRAELEAKCGTKPVPNDRKIRRSQCSSSIIYALFNHLLYRGRFGPQIGNANAIFERK